jgi:hypothetical protein
MGQSRKTQVICIGLSKELRLIACSRSYRVQVKGRPTIVFVKDGIVSNSAVWHDVQIIPRTQRQEDILFERVTAEAAFRRREQEYQTWVIGDFTKEVVHKVIYRVVNSGLYKGSQTWAAIRLGIGWRLFSSVTGRLSSKGQIDWVMFQNIISKHNTVVKALKADVYIWNNSIKSGKYEHMEMKYGFELGTGKTRNATQHSSWERYASAQSFGFRKKHHADASLRRIALQERQEQQNDRLRRLVSRYSDTLRFDWASVERGKEIQPAGPRSFDWAGLRYHHRNRPFVSDVDA